MLQVEIVLGFDVMWCGVFFFLLLLLISSYFSWRYFTWLLDSTGSALAVCTLDASHVEQGIR